MAFFILLLLTSDNPIGIFDSGLGGLTVARAVKQLLPDEQIIYFGDTIHLPYGDKSVEAITYYSEKIADFLLESKCKAVLIACNTASALSYEHVKKHVAERALTMNVIDPVVDYVVASPFKNIGIIGTKNTVSSGTYPKKIKEKASGKNIVSLATPLLVPMIEEGFVFDDISNAIIRAYLSDPGIKNIEALILGCTHYPIIKNQISKFYDFDKEVLDSAQIVAAALKSNLENNHMLNNSKRETKRDVFLVSDYTPYFPKISKMFFEKEIPIQQQNLWK